MKFNKSKKFFAGLMASLFISGVLIKPHALDPKAGDYETVFKNLTGMGDYYNGKYVFPKSIEDLNNETFVQAQKAAQKITSYPLCYEGVNTSPLRTTTKVTAEQLHQACLMYALTALQQNLEKIYKKTKIPPSQQESDLLTITENLKLTVAIDYYKNPMPVLNEFWYMLLSQLAAIHLYLLQTNSDLSKICAIYRPHPLNPLCKDDTYLVERLLTSNTDKCEYILRRKTKCDQGLNKLNEAAELIDDLYDKLFRTKTVSELPSVQKHNICITCPPLK